MVPILAAALAVLAQLAAAPQPFRPGAKVHFVTPQSKVLNGVPVQVHVGTPSQKHVLCTMPMLRPQTDVDPKIVRELPKHGAKIRTIDAPACIERASR
jgi:hypothetical protein